MYILSLKNLLIIIMTNEYQKVAQRNHKFVNIDITNILSHFLYFYKNH
jgi:hypothetical protein